MKYFLPIHVIFIIFFSNSSFAQVPIHLDTNNLAKGIYANFDEFKYNKPSMDLDFRLKERIFPNINTFTHTGYSLVTTSGGINLDGIWGVCDGKYVYQLSDEKTMFTKERWFEKILFLGRYSIFDKLIIGAREGTEGGVYINSNKVARMFISLKTGRTFELDYNSVFDALEKDPVLLSEYRKDPKNNRKLDFYLKKFAEKYKNDYQN